MARGGDSSLLVAQINQMSTKRLALLWQWSELNAVNLWVLTSLWCSTCTNCRRGTMGHELQFLGMPPEQLYRKHCSLPHPVWTLPVHSNGSPAWSGLPLTSRYGSQAADGWVLEKSTPSPDSSSNY
jgi:hypothetical protein